MVKLKSSGKFNDTEKFLKKMSRSKLRSIQEDSLQRYADELISSLQLATPKDTGHTAASWSYKIKEDGKNVRLDIFNDSANDGVSIALLLQYGHGTNGGGYVPGIDYINPAVQPIFDIIEDKFWKEVVK